MRWTSASMRCLAGIALLPTDVGEVLDSLYPELPVTFFERYSKLIGIAFSAILLVTRSSNFTFMGAV